MALSDDERRQVLGEALMDELHAIRENTDEIPAMKHDIGVLKHDVAELQSDMKVVKTVLKAVSTDICELRVAVARHETDIQYLKAKAA